MKKYIVEMQLSPTIHTDGMRYYWCVKLITDDGMFTVEDGWSADVLGTLGAINGIAHNYRS